MKRKGEETIEREIENVKATDAHLWTDMIIYIPDDLFVCICTISPQWLLKHS